MDSSRFVGCAVSIICGRDIYQGKIVHVDSVEHSIRITNSIRNGIQCKERMLTIKAGDISKIELIKDVVDASLLPEMKQNIHAPNPPPSEHLVAKPAPTAATTLRASPSAKHFRASPSQALAPPKNGYIKPRDMGEKENKVALHRLNDTPTKTATRHEKHHMNNAKNLKDLNEEFDIEGNLALFDKKKVFAEIKKGSGAASNKNKHAAPQANRHSPKQAHRKKTKETPASRKTPTGSNFTEDFDFESNLAMFDKRAVFEEIENGIAVAPTSKESSRPAKYGCHENVLPSCPVEFRQIRVTDSDTFEYVTDSGLVVPCIDESRRKQLMEAVEQAGLSKSAQVETVGRSAAEMILQLCGGSHRLSPKNAHQRPCVVMLVEANLQGCMAINCARQLASHQVNVTVLLPPSYTAFQLFESQLRLLCFEDNVKVTNLIKDLPCSPLDIIIDALEGQRTMPGASSSYFTAQMQGIMDWVKSVRAPVLVLDPPHGTPNHLNAKWQLTVGLPRGPPIQPAPKLYIMDLCVPKKIYQQVGIVYTSPFESKYVIPVHPKSEA